MNNQHLDMADNNKLKQAIQTLPNEIKPSRDLWAGIEQAVAKTPQDSVSQENKSSNVAVYSKIAAAALPLALVAGLMFQKGSQSTDEMPWLEPVVASYELQKRQLLRQVSHQQPLTPDYQATMQDLEQAEQALKTALQNQPGDPALMKMLNAVYQQQLDLIANSHQPSFTQI